MKYGAGSARGMTQRNYEMLAGALRDELQRTALDYSLTADQRMQRQLALESVAWRLMPLLGAGNRAFNASMFADAVRDYSPRYAEDVPR